MADLKYTESFTHFLQYYKAKQGKLFMKHSLIVLLSNTWMDL